VFGFFYREMALRYPVSLSYYQDGPTVAAVFCRRLFGRPTFTKYDFFDRFGRLWGKHKIDGLDGMIKILGRGSDTIGEFEGSRCVMTATELSIGGSWLADPSAAVIWQDWGILLLERGSVSGQNKLSCFQLELRIVWRYVDSGYILPPPPPKR
jgi:hypothetical protein